VRWRSTVRSWVRDILKLTIISLLILVAFFLIQGGMTHRHPLRAFMEILRGSFPITFSIGGVSWLVMPRVAERIGHWHPLIRWPVYLVTMTLTATAGDHRRWNCLLLRFRVSVTKVVLGFDT
jgi:hypothetical protein